MRKDIIVSRSILINADVSRVWEILTSPPFIRNYMRGFEVESSWERGSRMQWRGTYQDREINFMGEVLEISPMHSLKYTAFDPHAGGTDDEESYIHVAYLVKPKNGMTDLQVNISNLGGNEMRAQIAAEEWDLHVLPGIRRLAEVPVDATTF